VTSDRLRYRSSDSRIISTRFDRRKTVRVTATGAGNTLDEKTDRRPVDPIDAADRKP